MKTGYYAAHTAVLKAELAGLLDTEELRRLNRRAPWRHIAVLLRQWSLLAAGVTGVVLFRHSWFWIPFAILEGLTIFNFTVMLHEVLHGLVFSRPRPKASRFLEWLYALPSGLSASQFTRWHLDHHSELGSADTDPKRHYLSPKINRRWYKALYFTPALFVIYFRAAALASAGYPPELKRRVAGERLAGTALHLALFSGIWLSAGFGMAARVYLAPVFLVFPVAFALNRLGQHYDIRPGDPAQWSTLVKPSRFWDFAFLWSNYHLEHHYFPGVPFYNLPDLHRALRPFYADRGMKARGYGYLLYQYIVRNKAPHTDWASN